MTERMLAALSRLPVALFAIDEARCISQWGPAFRPEYAELCRLRERFPGVPIAALTATADEVTREDIAEKLFGGEVEQFVLGFDRPNITLAVEMKRDWKRQLQGFIARHEGESGIVYCLSRKKTEETAALLDACGVRALAYHAGMDAETREEHQNVFMTEPGVVIVATIAFGIAKSHKPPSHRRCVNLDATSVRQLNRQQLRTPSRAQIAQLSRVLAHERLQQRQHFISRLPVTSPPSLGT